MFVHPQIKLNIKNLKLFFGKSSEKKLKEKLSNVFPNCHFLLTDSGKSAFQIAIKELDLENSEMIIPAYICDVFKPILKHFNIKPIYFDIDLKTFQADLSNIESELSRNTKSILICHTYGLPVEIGKILEIAKKYNLKIIEDCAHVAPPAYPEKFGDCLFFSFAKLFPVINGGMLVLKKPINIKLENHRFELSNIVKFLRLFPFFAYLSEKFRPKEFLNNNSLKIPRKTSKWSLKIVNKYLDNNEQRIKKRIELAKYFQEKLLKLGFEVQDSKNNTFTYISALVPKNINRDKLFYKLRKKNIFCSRVWHNPLFNSPTGELPNTLEASERIINFPLQNWFEKEDIDKIISYIL